MIDAKQIHQQFGNDWPDWPQAMPVLSQVVDCLVDLAKRDGLLLTMGNGGSAADAGHIVGELAKSFRIEGTVGVEQLHDASDLDPQLLGRLEPGIRAMSLTDASSLLTAIGNDRGYDMVFAQQVWALARPGDVVLGLTTSGNSANVVNAMRVAGWRGAMTIGMTGPTSGKVGPYCDMLVQAPAADTYRIQEYHLGFYHAMCAMVEATLHE